MAEQTTTVEQAKQLGYYVERGAYSGTSDDRADRWYIGRYNSPSVDRRGNGYATKCAALDAEMAAGMLTTQQIADAVGVTRQTVAWHAVRGHLPGAVKAGRDWLVPARYADPAVYRQAVGTPGRRRGAEA